MEHECVVCGEKFGNTLQIDLICGKCEQRQIEEIKTYTHTEEGKDILNLLSGLISTHGMEVYKCIQCGELFGSRKEDEVCGICEGIMKMESRDAYGLESLDEEEE